MEISFRRNGRLYNQRYAWFPVQVTSGAWVWFGTYYSRENRNGWISMNAFEFLIDSSGD